MQRVPVLFPTSALKKNRPAFFLSAAGRKLHENLLTYPFGTLWAGNSYIDGWRRTVANMSRQC